MEQFLAILLLVLAFILGSMLSMMATSIKMEHPIVLGWPGVFYIVGGPNLGTLLVVLLFATLAFAHGSFEFASAAVMIVLGAISSPRLYELTKTQFAKAGH